MNLMKQLLRDESGFVVSSELVLVSTILVIGMVTGLATVRDAVVQELADTSKAIGNIEQSYTFNGITAHTSATNGSNFVDAPDFCEDGNQGTHGDAPTCLQLDTAVPTNGETDGPLAAAP